MRALGGRVPGPGGSGTGRERRRVWRERTDSGIYIKIIINI